MSDCKKHPKPNCEECIKGEITEFEKKLKELKDKLPKSPILPYPYNYKELLCTAYCHCCCLCKFPYGWNHYVCCCNCHNGITWYSGITRHFTTTGVPYTTGNAGDFGISG